MAYRIEQTDDIAGELRGIASEQLARLLAETADPALPVDQRVFQLRRRSKKLRALLRLIRHSFGGFRRENAAIRNAARDVADVRDAAAIAETLAALEAEVDAATIARVRARWSAREEPQNLKARLGRSRQALEAVARRVQRWTIGGEGFSVVEGGLVRSYREARAALDVALAVPDAEHLHAWRGRAKRHWSHLTLLRSVAPEAAEATRVQAGALARQLGEHHNLAVLRQSIGAEPILAAVIEDRQQALATEAFILGRELFAEPPRLLRRRWRALWEAHAAPEIAPV